ncbi:MAG: hypothetical protein ACYTF6_12875, partial [Planctomycetota bacterium]
MMKRGTYLCAIAVGSAFTIFAGAQEPSPTQHKATVLKHSESWYAIDMPAPEALRMDLLERVLRMSAAAWPEADHDA